ncbi:MAG: hypothetical protein KBS45_03110, partial [Clostridiales bacterium]|nr:hypothetical protein [Candidatus Coliplasma caballi]
IKDAELYNYYVNLLSMMGDHMPDEEDLRNHIRYATSDYREVEPGSADRLYTVLEIMLYTFYSAKLRKHAEVMLKELD